MNSEASESRPVNCKKVMKEANEVKLSGWVPGSSCIEWSDEGNGMSGDAEGGEV